MFIIEFKYPTWLKKCVTSEKVTVEVENVSGIHKPQLCVPWRSLQVTKELTNFHNIRS